LGDDHDRGDPGVALRRGAAGRSRLGRLEGGPSTRERRRVRTKLLAALFTLSATLVGANSATAEDQPAGAAPIPLEPVTVIAKRLQSVGAAIEPKIGASTYTATSEQIETQPGGENNTLNQVVLQMPGVTQDAESAGGIHVRHEMQPVEFRINGIPLPTGLSFFGQGLSPRFASSVTLVTGALPAEYGLTTSGIIDIETKSGLFAPGGEVAMYGGSYATLHPSVEYGGAVRDYSYFVSADLLSTNHGIDGVTPALTQIHDQSLQNHAFAYVDKIFDGENRLTVIASQFRGAFEIPNNPATPAFAGIGFLNGMPVSAFDPARLDERQTETSQFGLLSYLHSGRTVDFRVSAFTKYSTLDFRRDPSLADIALNGVAQDASLASFANGMQLDVSGRVAADHTLRSGLLVTAERFRSLTRSALLVQDGTDAAGNPTFGTTPTSSIPIATDASIAKTGWTYSGWLQDEWKISDEVTLNYGARFDVVDQFVSGHQLSPRVNTVWQATPTTALHAGYASLFTPPPFQIGPPQNIAQFNDFNGSGLTTSAATPSTGNSPLKIERANLVDIGIAQNLSDRLKVGVDAYYKFARNGVDFGQFGAPIITIPFNYRLVINKGVELTTSYEDGPFAYYGNLAIARQRAKGIVSGQFNFSPQDLATANAMGIQTDHSQLMTASAGVSYRWGDTRFALDLLAASGTRTTQPDGPINGASLPSWEQVNFSIAHRFETAEAGVIKLRFDVINVFDEIYLLRSSTSIGAFAPAFAPRRTFFAGLSKEF
jgi:outer membrane receptor protein involved in Fe transport